MHKPALRLLVVVCAGLYLGCSGYDPYRSPWDNLFSRSSPYYPGSTSSTTYSNSSSSAPRPRHRRERRRLARNRPAGGTSATASSSESVTPKNDPATPAAVVASNPPATLSMAGDGDARAHAQRLLAAVDTKLGRARAHGLKGSQKETYERASQLAHRAHRALAEDDCAAASSLAAKASSLAAGIAEQ